MCTGGEIGGIYREGQNTSFFMVCPDSVWNCDDEDRLNDWILKFKVIRTKKVRWTNWLDQMIFIYGMRRLEKKKIPLFC